MTFGGSGPLFYFYFSLFAFVFLFFLAFDVSNVVILFFSLFLFTFSNTNTHPTTTPNLIFEKTFGRSKVQEAKIEEKPTKLGHETQTNIKET